MKTAEKPLVEIKNLFHSFPDGTQSLCNVNLNIFKRDFIVLTGNNGSGKTVLMMHLNGLHTPAEGEILFEGESIYKDIIRTRTNIGYVFQNADVQIIGHTVKDDIAIGPMNAGFSRKESLEISDRIMQQLGIKHLSSRFPHDLSGGEKRRLALAAVLAVNPRLIIFDEPFENLDKPGTRLMHRMLNSLRSDGHTIIVVTHRIDLMNQKNIRIITMNSGQIKSDCMRR